MRAGWLAVLLTVGLVGCTGYRHEAQFTSNARMDRGMVVLLPGIEGEGLLSASVRKGLDDAGVDAALPIYNWGRPVPIAGPLLNQVDFIGNRLAADDLAKMIVAYQDKHPGQPIHLVGHSGGGGIAIFAAEVLPPGREVEGIILLNASISAGYDLTKAMAHTRKGIVNFWSPGDFGLLIFGTTLVGNVDGAHGPAAGGVGFGKSACPEEFRHKLYQVEWNESMASSGNMGDHLGSVGTDFVSEWVSPWVKAGSWTPPPTAAAVVAARTEPAD